MATAQPPVLSHQRPCDMGEVGGGTYHRDNGQAPGGKGRLARRMSSYYGDDVRVRDEAARAAERAGVEVPSFADVVGGLA